MSKSVTADVTRLLQDYIGDATEIVEKSARDAADICTNQLRNTSPSGRGRKGHYSSGWTVKEESSGRIASFIVYNKKKPQLTHLLENGHVIRNKKGTYGRTKPIKHIEPAEEAAVQKFELRVRARLRSMR